MRVLGRIGFECDRCQKRENGIALEHSKRRSVGSKYPLVVSKAHNLFSYFMSTVKSLPIVSSRGEQ